MSMDRELLEEYKLSLADKYNATELVSLMEDAGMIDVWTILELLEDQIMELKFR